MEADKGSGEIQGTLYFGYCVHALSDRGESGGAKGTVNHDRRSGKGAGKYVLLHNYEADADFAGTLSAADSFPVFKQLSGA